MTIAKVRRVTEGAYFVPSYSEQTILAFQPGITNQTVAVVEEIERANIAPLEEEQPAVENELGDSLRKVSQTRGGAAL